MQIWINYFFSAENQVLRSSSSTAAGNQVIRKGYMSLQNVSIIKGRSFWFVLSSDSLAWFKDDTEKEIHYILPLNKLKLRDVETKMMSRKPTFAIFYPNGANVYKVRKIVEPLLKNTRFMFFIFSRKRRVY